METDEEIINLLANMGRLVRKEIFMSDCMADFTHSDIEILFFLVDRKEVPMKSLSGHLKIKPPSVTPIIERLCKKGMLKRSADKKDRRITYISLTKKGKALIEKKRLLVKKQIKKFFSKVGQENKKSLIKILNAILKKYE